MGLYTKKVKEDTPAKEAKKPGAKKPGRPKKVVQVEASELDVEPPKVEEPVQLEKELPTEPEKVEPQIPREKTPPPPEPVQVEEPPLKKPAPKKKEVKKVEKKAAKPKEQEEAIPKWFQNFVKEIGHNPNQTKKENTDLAKDMASKLWNDRVKPKSHNPERVSNNYEKLYNQIFGR
jgi:hypothetical protein